ncbi:MAG: ParB N-terminal domain-containing protein [Ignavibacteria bacterium]|nr:ParB N-terminal domain-containing protein [Ignavibacteria bacterium]MBL7992111.1 ParB N-terminal domain-containing protein [Candidatus Kapabacteria bacterium]
MSKRFAPNPTASLRRVQSVRTGVSLSDIKNMAVDDIRTNPQNTVFFVRESTEYFQRLREDIEKRGVVVPLLVKQDGMLLAGHNRLQIAREIGLRFVPVQTVQEELSERQEQEFIINDNLLRRHLSIEERIRLYKMLFPEFESVLAASKRGGDKKSAEFKELNKTSSEKNQNDSVSLKSNMKGTILQSGNQQEHQASTIQELAKKIATTTGQNISTVKQQLTRAKRAEKQKTTDGKLSNPTTKTTSKKNQNDTVVLIQQLDSVLSAITSAPVEVQKAVRKKLENFLSTLGA